MNLDTLRRICLSFPHATETLQWGDYLLLKVGGKMFAILALEPGGSVCSLRTTPERYFELVELQDVNPASHNMWKYHWVELERYDVLSENEWQELLRGSYDLIYAGLPKKTRAMLESVPTGASMKTVKRARAKKARAAGNKSARGAAKKRSTRSKA